jgi:hypothetical protein
MGVDKNYSTNSDLLQAADDVALLDIDDNCDVAIELTKKTVKGKKSYKLEITEL